MIRSREPVADLAVAPGAVLKVPEDAELVSAVPVTLMSCVRVDLLGQLSEIRNGGTFL